MTPKRESVVQLRVAEAPESVKKTLTRACHG